MSTGSQHCPPGFTPEWAIEWDEAGIHERTPEARWTAAEPGFPLTSASLVARFGALNVTSVSSYSPHHTLGHDQMIVAGYTSEMDRETVKGRFVEFARWVLDISQAELELYAEWFAQNWTQSSAHVRVGGPFRVDQLSHNFTDVSSAHYNMVILGLPGTLTRGETWSLSASIPYGEFDGLKFSQDDRVKLVGPGYEADVKQQARARFETLGWDPPSFANLTSGWVSIC